MKGNIKYQTKKIIHEIDGISTSKKTTRRLTNNLGANGNQVSPKVHGYEYKDDIEQITKELGNFAKMSYSVKDMQLINNSIILAFIGEKIEDGILHKSLKVYVSKLEKIYIGLSQIPKKYDEHKQHFDRSVLAEIRLDIDYFAIKSEHKNRAYISPNLIINNMEKMNKLAAQLQLNFGLRVSEATQIFKEHMLSNNQILINGKGGFIRIINVDNKLYNILYSHIKSEGSFAIPYSKYLLNFKIAVKKSAQEYNGTHGLRYNFAQSQFEKYCKKIPVKSALQKISYELGHKRLEITRYYLK